MNTCLKDYGAKGDGVFKNTAIIQKAIDDCSNNGGGKIILENGVYMTGTIILKSGIELHISQNATLLGSPDCADYPERDVKHINSDLLPRWRNACLIYAEEAENIAITGMGKIDCNGKSFVVKADEKNYWGSWKYVRINAPTPPRVVFFAGCKNVKIEDITMINQPSGWSYWIHDCDCVSFDKIKIFAEVEYPNNDGIHINCSQNVTISNCNIVCGDDCIVVRANSVSLKENKICEKVTVTNCNLTSYSGGIRIGWLCDGVIRNCAFSNIVMTDCTVGIDIYIPYYLPDPEKKIAQFADIGREYTRIENLTFSNIILYKIYDSPLRLHLEEGANIDCIQNLYFNGIHSNSCQHMRIEGQKNKPFKKLRFTDCDFEIIDTKNFSDPKKHGASMNMEEIVKPPIIKFVKDLTFNNTNFNYSRED